MVISVRFFIEPMPIIYLAAAVNPADFTIFESSSTLTLSLRTLITAWSGKVTSALMTFWCLVSASCTLETHPTHVIPDTTKAISLLAFSSIGTDIKISNCSPVCVSNILILPSKPPAASCVPSG